MAPSWMAARLRAGALVALVGSLSSCRDESAARAPSFDPAALTAENFHRVLDPVAKAEGSLVFYNTAGNFDSVWKTGLIPRFEARYGVRVEYRDVRRELADQQLIAIHRAHESSPVDVYFAGGSDRFGALDAAGVVSDISLARVLPNLAAVAPAYKDVVFGVDTHGRWPIVHVSQIALGYDPARLAPADVPTTFDGLLAWAESHPHRFAFTSPTKGGSGSGFLYSAAVHVVQDERCRGTLRNMPMNEDAAAAWAASADCLRPFWAYMSRLLRASDVTNGNADTLNLLDDHAALLGTVWEDLAHTFVERQLLPPDFRVALLRDGLAASGDGLMLPEDARHPAAALLFIDMAFDPEFQAWKLSTHASRSPRPDVERLAATLDASHVLMPAEQMAASSIPVNWRTAHALARVLEDKLVDRL